MQNDISEGIQEPGRLLVSACDWRARERIDGSDISDCKSRLLETMVSISTNMELRGSDFGLVDQLVSWTKMMTGEASQDCSTGQDVS